jgi:hypothetical protein
MHANRSSAFAAGAPRYFTGKPCKKGHVAERFTNNATCVECHRLIYYYKHEHNKERNRMNCAKNRERERARAAEWYANNLDKARARNKARYWVDVNASRQDGRKRYAKNPEPGKVGARRRKINKKSRTPLWHGELDEFVFCEALTLASERGDATGIKWHVDHMIPLLGKKASGLHVAGNLQVIPAAMNMEKHNRMILTECMEWLK